MAEKIIRQPVEQAVGQNFLDYAMSVITDRALPDGRDGLKPVHRRLLYAMHEAGNMHNKPYRKSARSVGDAMGKYHPHGDSSIYEAMVNLAQDFGTRYPLVDMHGNVGSLDGDAAAAMRYTESRLSAIAEQMCEDINKNTVDFGRNYDDTLNEPTCLPTLLPIMLMNGVEGIAVGMATRMAPYNLTEILDAVDYMLEEALQGNEPDMERIYSIMKGPDFPLGAQIIGTAGIRQVYETGKGSIKVRSTYEIEERKGMTSIVITEIPYQVNKATLVSKIDALRKNGVIDIREVRDESSKKDIKIVIDLKKDANVQLTINKLLKQTEMEKSFSTNNTILVNGQPKCCNLKELLDIYAEHAVDVVTRRTQFNLDKASTRLHIVNGILWAIHADNIDQVVYTVRTAATNEEAIRNLMALDEDLSEEQAKAINDLRIRQLTVNNQTAYQEEADKLETLVANYTEILEDNAVLLTTLRAELNELKAKFGDARRTVINPTDDEVNEIDCIEEETLVITFSTDNIIKSVEEKEYRNTRRGAKGVKAGAVKEDEAIKTMLTVNSKQDLLFFTNLGRCHTLKAYKIPKSSRSTRGKSINNYLSLDEGEVVVSMITTDLNDQDSTFALVTRDGVIKRLRFSELSTRFSSTKVITFKDDDILVAVQVMKDEDQIVITTACGMSIRFKGEQVRAMGRTAAGVKGIDLREHDYVVDAVTVEDDAQLLTITKYGLGKRTDVSEYNCQSRGGKGIITHKLNEKTGELVCANVVTDDHELFVATAQGQIVRLDASTIRVAGRSTSGVKIANLNEGDYIVSVSRNLKEPEEDLEVGEE